MPRQTSKATNPWAALAAEIVNSGIREPKGEGWIGADDLPGAMGCGKSKANDIIKRLMAEGRAERFAGSAPTAGGLIRSRVWFRLKS